MASKKVFILLPDGIGLRNFAFSSFNSLSSNYDWQVIYWNQTPFDLKMLNLEEIKLNADVKPITDILKRAVIKAELDHFEKKFNDPVYDSYKFPTSPKTFKQWVKIFLVNFFKTIFLGKKGIKILRSLIKKSERKSSYYKHCRSVLEKEKPDLIFSTSQRPITAIAPIMAAEDLGIPTSCFIFSWDNLSKATLILETNYYFVWSDLMQEELLRYYPWINKEQIKITGTPQFEKHSDQSIIESKNTFFKKYNLSVEKKYICFSGDDITTSPDDPQYLNDLAIACKKLNSQGYNIGIIFRRCPVDFSRRYDKVIEKHSNIITRLEPDWSNLGSEWGNVLPNQADHALLLNTIYHSEAVYNLGSTMVFDAALLNKPCFYINYNVEQRKNPGWDVKKIYQYVHFRSIPENSPVIWINKSSEIEQKLKLINSSGKTIKNADSWFKVINRTPESFASDRIWCEMNKIHDRCI